MPAMGVTGEPADMRTWAGAGWEPERTWHTPRIDREGVSGTARALRESEIMARQRRTPDPGPDTLSGQKSRRENYGGGVRRRAPPVPRAAPSAPRAHS